MERENLILINNFCEHHTIEPSFIHSLVEQSIIEVVEIDSVFYFHEDFLEKIEKLLRLHIDLSINIEGLDVILQLLEKIENLEQELKEAKNKLKSFE